MALPADTTGIERDASGEPTGKLFLDANWRAQAAFMARMPLDVRRSAERRAIELALANGALHLHAQLLGFSREEYAVEIHSLRAHAAKIHPKICEPDATIARELGLPYIGGDVFLDGSIGSRTAAFTSRMKAKRVAERCAFPTTSCWRTIRKPKRSESRPACMRSAMRRSSNAFAFGSACLAGKPSPRGSRHFIEHFEMATPEHIEACARMGIYLSMQPQFDELWGGAGRMYDVRLGSNAMHAMNALGRIEAAGGVLCGGDDSPVCELSPLAGMQACVDHHEPGERLAPERALAMYTVNAARFGYTERQTGNIVRGSGRRFRDARSRSARRRALCGLLGAVDVV